MKSIRAKDYESKKLADLPQWGMEIWLTHVDFIKEQDKNPRVQPPEMMERLIKTIGRDKRLESLPFCAFHSPTDFEMISGHHRLRAAKAAQLEEIVIMVDITDLTRDQIVSKQLAHNNIDGITDRQLMKELYDNIGDIESKLEAFVIDDEMRKKLAEPIKSIIVDIEWKMVSFTFLPSHIDKLDDLIDQLKVMDKVYIADTEQYDKFKNALLRVKEEKGIRHTGTAIDFMVNIATKELDKDGTEEGQA